MSETPENQQQYGSILTILGENAEQNGKLQNKQITFTHIAIGDANDTYIQPDRKQNALTNELARIPVNSVDVLQPTPESVPMLKVEAVLPDDVNDLVIREFAAVATFDGNTYFHAVGNCARIYVPAPVNNGNVSTPVTLEMIFVITSAEPIIEIDPNVITASREYVHHVAGYPWSQGNESVPYRSYLYQDEGIPVAYYDPNGGNTMGKSPDSPFFLASKAKHVAYQRKTISAAIQQVIKLNIQDKLDVLSSVRDYGAIGDGNSHPVSEMFSGLTAAQMVYPHVTSMDDELDWAASQACVNAGVKLVQFDTNANYVFNQPLKYDPQTTFYSPASGISYSSARAATIKIQRETWDGSDAILSKRNRESSYQAIIVDGLSFIGYAAISYNNLSAAEDIGVSAIDISYIRDGAILRNCAFDRLGMSAQQISKTGYLGFCVIDNCHITRCYKAFEGYPTTRLTILNSRIYDCYDWISSNTVLLVNVSFNNSSFSSESCGIHADNIHSLNCWYEGGNNWFDTSNCLFASSIKIEGGFMSEAMSANGSTKLIFKPNWDQKQYIEISGGLSLPENTRLFNGDLNKNWSNMTLKLQGCRNVGSNWSLTNGLLESFLYAGLNYEGESNSARDGYTDPRLNSVMTSISAVFDEVGVTPKLTTAAGVTLNVSVDKARSTSPFSVDRNAFVTFNVVGNSNGSGGSQIFALQFSLLHGYGTNWTLCESFSHEGAVVTSLSINGFTISIAAETETSCQLTIIPTHAGTKSQTNWFATMKSANVFISES